jgi:hypothetical protein
MCYTYVPETTCPWKLGGERGEQQCAVLGLAGQLHGLVALLLAHGHVGAHGDGVRALSDAVDAAEAADGGARGQGRQGVLGRGRAHGTEGRRRPHRGRHAKADAGPEEELRIARGCTKQQNG